MIDTLLAQRARFDPTVERERLGLPETFGVVTLHRPSNVDDAGSWLKSTETSGAVL